MASAPCKAQPFSPEDSVMSANENLGFWQQVKNVKLLVSLVVLVLAGLATVPKLGCATSKPETKVGRE
jgi:hypothetical protein